MNANKYFDVKELVSKNIYSKYKEESIKFLDSKALEVLENVRDILGVPLVCNNWARGGTRHYCGYREPDCSVGAIHSMHKEGKAFDLISSKMTAKEMRDILEKNQDKLIQPIRVEK